MRKFFTHLTGALIVLLVSVSVSMAQNVTISGTVSDKSSNETLPGVSVTVKGKSIGTSTNSSGKFSLSTNEKTPFTIVVSYIGYKTVEATVNGPSASLNFQLEAQSVLGQEVVVAASRTPERILESPVSIERVSAAAIREGANNSYYDALANLKGVETSSQSLTFRSVNTRGFNANGNTRVNQLTDGMDNQAPGLNFSVGNILGLSELDVESVELLPGASSALYGSGGTNGTIIMNSKNPFTYPGFSAQLRTGVNHISDDNQKASPLYDYSFRYAKSWNNKWAFKTSVSYLSAKDWQTSDYSNFDRVNQTTKAGTRADDPGYDGVNTYGDETQIPSLKSIAANYYTPVNSFVAGYTAANSGTPPTQSQIISWIGTIPQLAALGATNVYGIYAAQNLYPTNTFTRTGYNESDLVDYDTKSIRTLNAVHYKINNTVEAVLQGNWGSGTTVYTGSERYSIKNFKLAQYKLEVKGSDFYVRAYTTRENSGDSYNATALAAYINETYSASSTSWVPTYLGAYTNARLSLGLTNAQANAAARTAADASRFKPGTSVFESAKDLLTSRVIGSVGGGAKFADKTFMNQFEGMYNFSSLLKNVVDVQVGGSYRQYNLNSNGTIFDDKDKDLTIDEYGAFLQVGKKLLNDKLKLSAATRYDKSQNFEGQFTPRISAVYSVVPNNNIRVSYQTGFRIPTTQNQYINLNTGSTTLLGGIASVLDGKGLRSGIGQGYTRESVAAGSPVKYNFASDLKPESAKSFEVGYKGLVTKSLLVDAYYYNTTYKNFIASLALLRAEDANGVPTGAVPTTSSKSYGTVVNDPNKVKSDGFGLGLDYLYGDYKFSANVSSDRLKENNSTLQSEFNTPEFRYNLGIANRNIIKNVGANVTYRWQDAYQWQSSFITGKVEAFGTLDAQVNFRMPKQKLTFKAGGSNILNKYYRTNYGNPMVGAVYYVSFTFDQLMK
ncbi:MAG: TonB-dependent receptor [Sphingobacteriaceae bacterium]